MIEFRILGPLEVERDGQPLALGGPKQRAVLAALLLRHGEVVSTDRLIEDVWGDAAPSTSDHTAQVYISNLRKALAGEREYIVSRPAGYIVRLEPDELDLFRFERLVAQGREALAAGDPERSADRLRAALRLWRGAALADFAYEAFAQGAILRLEELRLAALEDRVDADLARGRHADLVGEVESLIAEHPLRERPRGQLMLALYRSGRQAEALEAYQDARRALVEELGIDPSPALQQLERAILNHDPELELARATPAPATRGQTRRSILVLPLTEEALARLLAVAEPLARSQAPHDLILARLLEPGQAGDLSTVAADLNATRAVLAEKGVGARAGAFTSHDRAADTVRLASEQGVDLLLLDAPAPLLGEGPFEAGLERIFAEAPCDVALLTGSSDAVEDGAVLVPFAGGEHDWSALELGGWIASARGSPLRLLGTDADEEGGRRDASRLLAAASFALQQIADVAAEPLLAEPGAASIVETARTALVTVVGLSPRWKSEGLGATRLQVARNATSPVLLVRRGVRPGGLAPSDSLTKYTWSLSGKAQGGGS
jgi:DNA-binding SARP family transcriptional activator